MSQQTVIDRRPDKPSTAAAEDAKRTYGVVKRISFCYGHRIQGHGGKCAHPHGHNGLLEIELGSDGLDAFGMVRDFADVKALLGDFIESELDHRMLLRSDDPLVEALNSVGERPFCMEVHPTAENIARLVFEKGRQLGLPMACVRLWETEDACGIYRGAG